MGGLVPHSAPRSSSAPTHAQSCLLIRLNWAWLTNALTVVLVIASLCLFAAMNRPADRKSPPRPLPPRALRADSTAGPAAGLPLYASPSASAVAWAIPLRTSPTPTSTAVGAAASGDAFPASALAADGIPATALLAYRQAAAWEDGIDPGCGIQWPLLAAIGRIESDHGRYGGAVLHTDGTSTPKVIGMALNGQGTALIRDTDHGRLDGDPIYDHAVGPMQFIPSTWAVYGVDATHSGVADPFNIFDAAAAAARYLCAAGGNLSTVAGQARAVLAYNHSDWYVATVLSLEQAYAAGVPGEAVLVGTGAPPRPTPAPSLPAVNPGPPLAPGPLPGVPHQPSEPAGAPDRDPAPDHIPPPVGGPTTSPVTPTSTSGACGQPSASPATPSGTDSSTTPGTSTSPDTTGTSPDDTSATSAVESAATSSPTGTPGGPSAQAC